VTISTHRAERQRPSIRALCVSYALVMLVDESKNYREVIKGRELLEEIVRSGQHARSTC